LILSMFGWLTLLRQRDPAAMLLGLAFLTLMGGIMLIWVEARLRTPTVVFMIPLAAYGIVYGIEHFPVRGRTVSRSDLKHFALSAAMIIAVLSIAQVFYLKLPRPVIVDELPDSAQRAEAVYDQTLKLVGWEIQESYSRAGIIEPFHPYVVSLYWELLKPTPIDYNFALAFVVDGERVLGTDHPIGYVSHPRLTTSQWETRKIYVEHVSLAYKEFSGPVEISGDLLLSVYSDRTAIQLLPAEGVPSAPTHLRLAQPALIWGTGELPDMIANPAEPIPFGNILRLAGWTYPCVVKQGKLMEVTLGWHTTQQPISRSYIFAVYILSETHDITAQADSPPHNGRLLSTSLPTNFAFSDTKQFSAPSELGVYSVYTAIYDYETKDRLTIPGVSDGLFKLGTIEVSSLDVPQTADSACYADKEAAK